MVVTFLQYRDPHTPELTYSLRLPSRAQERKSQQRRHLHDYPTSLLSLGDEENWKTLTRRATATVESRRISAER